VKGALWALRGNVGGEGLGEGTAEECADDATEGGLADLCPRMDGLVDELAAFLAVLELVFAFENGEDGEQRRARGR
jgi:hypothetical protein